jgi:hypothetical protein
MLTVPENFKLHPTLQRIFQGKKLTLEKGDRKNKT